MKLLVSFIVGTFSIQVLAKTIETKLNVHIDVGNYETVKNARKSKPLCALINNDEASLSETLKINDLLVISDRSGEADGISRRRSDMICQDMGFFGWTREDLDRRRDRISSRVFYPRSTT